MPPFVSEELEVCHLPAPSEMKTALSASADLSVLGSWEAVSETINIAAFSKFDSSCNDAMVQSCVTHSTTHS